jgi:hypothetical protein
MEPVWRKRPKFGDFGSNFEGWMRVESGFKWMSGAMLSAFWGLREGGFGR